MSAKMNTKVLDYTSTLDTTESLVVWAIYRNQIDEETFRLADGISNPKSECVKMLCGFLPDRIENSKKYRLTLILALADDINSFSQDKEV